MTATHKPAIRKRSHRLTSSRNEHVDDTASGQSFPKPRDRKKRKFAVIVSSVLVLAVFISAIGFPGVAFANTERLEDVLNNLRLWIVGIAGTIVAVMLTIAGVRYLLASDPGETEKAKTALRASAIGFAIVLLAPILVAILRGILG